MKYSRSQRLLILKKLANRDIYIELFEKYFPSIKESLLNKFSNEGLSRSLKEIINKEKVYFYEEMKNDKFEEFVNELVATISIFGSIQNPELELLPQYMIELMSYKFSIIACCERPNDKRLYDTYQKNSDIIDEKDKIIDKIISYYKNLVIENMISLIKSKFDIEYRPTDYAIRKVEHQLGKYFAQVHDYDLHYKLVIHNKNYIEELSNSV